MSYKSIVIAYFTSFFIVTNKNDGDNDDDNDDDDDKVSFCHLCAKHILWFTSNEYHL